MIDIFIDVIFCELILLLGILIVYWLDYTYSYIHCHCRTEPYPKMKFNSEYGWIESSKTIDAHDINEEDIPETEDVIEDDES